MNYSNTIIYKIVCKDVDIKECYVGQTTNFSKRKASHKSNCINTKQEHHNCYVYQFMREHGNWNNWDMVEVEKYLATDKLDAHKRERYWIETLGAKLNKAIPTRTDKEYYEANKEQIKEYYEQNKEQILKKNSLYREQNKESYVESQKKHYEKNRDYFLEYKKNWYEQNKEQIVEENKLKYDQNKDKINAQRRLRRALKKEQSIESSL